MAAVGVFEDGDDCIADFGTEMNWEDDAEVRVCFEDFVDCGCDAGHEGCVFSAVGCDGDEGFSALVEGVAQLGDWCDVFAITDDAEGVDAGVSCDPDSVALYVFCEEVLLCALGWGEVEICQGRDHAAVHLFGEGLPFVAGSQACFEVCDVDAFVVGGECADVAACGVALDDDAIGAVVSQDCSDALTEGGCQVGEGLAGAHDVEVVGDGDVEDADDLVEHFAVLPCEDGGYLEIIAGGEVLYDGCDLDGFRARAEYEADLYWFMRHGSGHSEQGCGDFPFRGEHENREGVEASDHVIADDAPSAGPFLFDEIGWGYFYDVDSAFEEECERHGLPCDGENHDGPEESREFVDDEFSAVLLAEDAVSDVVDPDAEGCDCQCDEGVFPVR